MSRSTLALALSIALVACTAPSHEVAPANAAGLSIEPVWKGHIPVDDPKTRAIAGTLFEPNGSGRFPAVVLLSGCAGVDTDATIVRRVNADYMSKGIAALVIDSFTSRGISEVCSNQKMLVDSIAFRVQDTYAAVAWLAGRPEIDSKRIFLQGYSHGAMTAIAAVDTQLPQRKTDHVAGVIAYYPYCFQSSRFSVPTIILVGEKDDWTPSKRCEEIVDKTNVEITVYPNAFHQFAAPGTDITYLGHRLLYDPAATNDAQRRAMELIHSRGK